VLRKRPNVTSWRRLLEAAQADSSPTAAVVNG